MNDDFKNWCDLCHVTEMYAVDMIWWMIPMEEIKTQYRNGLDYVQTAYQYWIEHAVALQQVIRYDKKVNLEEYFSSMFLFLRILSIFISN